MGSWPAGFGAARWEDAGVDLSATVPILVTSGGSANTKGSYAELIASTAFDARGFLFGWTSGPGSRANYLADIAIGAAASEQIIVPDLLVCVSGSTQQYVYIPIPVKAGSRLAVRTQSPAASSGARMCAYLVDGGWFDRPGLGRVTGYGVATADSGGVSVDPGGTANTKGGYSEIVASTTNPIRWALLAFGTQNNAAMSSALWAFDFAVGAANQIIVPDLITRVEPSNCHPQVVAVPLSVAAGQRLAARAQCNITDATDRLLDVAIYGID